MPVRFRIEDPALAGPLRQIEQLDSACRAADVAGMNVTEEGG